MTANNTDSASKRRSGPPLPLIEMEGSVCDVARVGRILIHMSTSEEQVEPEEVGWIGGQLVSLGTTLERLFYAAHRECGGSGRGDAA